MVPPSPLGEATLYSAVLFAAGLILFGITVIRAGVLPRIGGWLLVIGGVLSRVMPILHQRADIYPPGSIPGDERRPDPAWLRSLVGSCRTPTETAVASRSRPT